MTLELFPEDQPTSSSADPQQPDQANDLPAVVAFLESRWGVFQSAYKTAIDTAAKLKSDEIEHTRCEEYQVAFNWDVDSCRNGFDEVTNRVIRRTVDAFQAEAARSGGARLEVSADVVRDICWEMVHNEDWRRDVKRLRHDFSPAGLYTKLQKLYPPSHARNLIRQQAAAELKNCLELDRRRDQPVEMKKSGRFTTLELRFWGMEKNFGGSYELNYQTENHLSALLAALLAVTNLIVTDDPTSPLSVNDLHLMKRSLAINRRRYDPRQSIGGESMRITFYTSKAELRLDNRIADALNLFISENS